MQTAWQSGDTRLDWKGVGQHLGTPGLRPSSRLQATFVALLATGSRRIQTWRSHALRSAAKTYAALVVETSKNGCIWPYRNK